MAETARATLPGLPDELLHLVLSYLEPAHLAIVAQTSHRMLQQSYDDLIWQPLVNRNLHSPISEPAPLASFRDLYIAHHPHWFLTRHRIWFADSEHMGKLLLARYEPTSGSIEAFAVAATTPRGPFDWQSWETDPEVKIISFNPEVLLDLRQPVVKLDVDSSPLDNEGHVLSRAQIHKSSSICRNDLLMKTFQEAGLWASFVLCRTLPETAIDESTRVWPPLCIPSQTRVRNSTSSDFKGSGHRPTRFAEISEHSFRVRKWVEYSGRHNSRHVLSSFGQYFAAGLRSTSMDGRAIGTPENITTFATLPESCYMPTPEKPYQGIWCGDYSGHGCEFLVIRQRDEDDGTPLPSGMDWLQSWFRGRQTSMSSESSYASAHEGVENVIGTDLAVPFRDEDATDESVPVSAAGPDNHLDPNDVPTGRLEAIKLTGDPNIPRGEYTFIAPDIGHGGFLRTADESQFRGARVVRSAGHIAGRGFRDDQYTRSQLIMISHNRLAQYWEGFGHILYFQRVDLDALMRSR